ncbi:hypothetical protein ACFL09_02590 [Planctomycetota bacterium]
MLPFEGLEFVESEARQGSDLVDHRAFEAKPLELVDESGRGVPPVVLQVLPHASHFGRLDDLPQFGDRQRTADPTPVRLDVQVLEAGEGVHRPASALDAPLPELLEGRDVVVAALGGEAGLLLALAFLARRSLGLDCAVA